MVATSGMYMCQPVMACWAGASPVRNAVIAVAVVEGNTEVNDPSKYRHRLLPG
jgi:hypothetical protein